MIMLNQIKASEIAHTKRTKQKIRSHHLSIDMKNRKNKSRDELKKKSDLFEQTGGDSINTKHTR